MREAQDEIRDLASRQGQLSALAEALVEAAQDFIFAVDRSGIVQYANTFTARSVGATTGQLVGTPLANWFPPAVFQRQWAAIERVLATSEPVVMEQETPFPKTTLWLDTVLVPVRDEHGAVIAVLGISRDVTERKKMERALRESEARYRTLVDTSPDGITVTDLEGRFLMVNRRALEFQGYSSFQQLLASGRSPYDLIAPEHRQRAIDNARQLFEHGDLSNIEYDILRADGSTYPAEVSVAIIPDSEGKPMHMVGVARDVTARKRAEEAFAAEKERLQVTLASIADGVITTDTQGRVVLLNRVSERLTGYTQADAMGRPLVDVLALLDPKTREPYDDPVRAVLETGKASGATRRAVLVAKDGGQRVVMTSAAPIRAEDGATIGVVLAVHDVTEGEKLEREQQRIETLESTGILAAGIAHDVNNIMTAVLGNISLAKAYALHDERVLGRLTEAESAIGRAKDLTRQLLTFAKGAAPEKRTAAIGELIRETAAFALRGSDVGLSCHLPLDLWPVDVDEAQISQVIANLVLNADQAQPLGGRVEVTASNLVLPGDAIVPLPAGRYVRVSVSDRGVGIAPEHLARIFDPYFTTKPRGSGLGLTICHAIVRNHGGHLTAESGVGEGTTFHVYLPAARQSAPPSSKTKASTVRGTGRVLLVDDDRAIREVSQLMLQFLGYEVETAAEGNEALAAYRSALGAGRRFDVVVVDLTIPGGLGGRETIVRLLEMDPEVCGIVSSGYSEDPVMAEPHKYGFRGAVVKPYRIEEISQTLAKVIPTR